MRRVRAVSVVVYAMLLMVAMVPPAVASDHVISTSTTLTHDLGSGVVINADNVTLDCAGHSITGPGWGDGVLVERGDGSGISGVTVRNCVIQGFARGIVVARSTDAALESNTVQASASGIQVESSTGFFVTDNDVAANGWGIILFNGDDGAVSGNSVTLDGFGWSIGFGFEQGSERNAVADNLAVGVGGSRYQGSMFNLSEGSNDNLLVGNRAERGGHGFYLTGVSNNTLRINVSERSVGGFGIDNSSLGNLLEDNSALSYLGGGFGLSDWDELWNPESPATSGNILRSNMAVAGEGVLGSGFGAFVGVESTILEDNISVGGGFLLDGAVDNSLAGNLVEDVPEAAFVLVGGAHDNTLTGNTARRAGSGFDVADSDRARLVGNTARVTNGAGFHLGGESTTETVLIGNSAFGGFAGFHVERAVGARLEGNSARNTGIGYLVGQSARNQLHANTVAGAAEDGFRLEYSTDNLLASNRATGSGRWGFIVRDASHGNILDSNSASGNGIDGILVLGSPEDPVLRSTLTGNTTNGNAVSGTAIIWIGDTTVSDSAANGNGENGFSVLAVDGTHTSLTGNRACDNGIHDAVDFAGIFGLPNAYWDGNTFCMPLQSFQVE